jgi:hypothetical protein
MSIETFQKGTGHRRSHTLKNPEVMSSEYLLNRLEEDIFFLHILNVVGKRS